MPEFTLYNFTEPLCTWCWAAEPRLRKLEVEYDGHLEIYSYIGMLVQDIRTMQDPGIGFYAYDVPRSNANLMKYWQSHEDAHHMPVDVLGFELFTDQRYSSETAGIALEAARLADERLFPAYLRRLREALFTERRPITDEDTLLTLAEEVGYDPETFTTSIVSGRAKAFYREGLITAEKYGITSYPTNILVYKSDGNEDAILLRGHVPYETFAQAIDNLSEGSIKRQPLVPTAASVEQLSQRYPQLAVHEIAEILEVSDAKAEELATEAGLIRRAVGKSAMFSRKG